MRALLFTVLFATSVLSVPVEDGGSTAEPKIRSRDEMEGDHFQGDIILSPEQEEFFLGEPDETSQRTGLRDLRYRWPKIDGVVTVPYAINADSEYTDEQVQLIRGALDEIESMTCIKFVPHSNENDSILVTSGKGCHSRLGKQGGEQKLTLNNTGCMVHKKIMHEFIHALGYTHMHNHAERGKFVTIHLENVIAGHEKNFKLANNDFYDNFGTPYDYESVMHYRRDSFSAFDDEDTIVPTDEKYIDIIGNVKHLSAGDVLRLRTMYNCDEKVKEEGEGEDEGDIDV